MLPVFLVEQLPDGAEAVLDGPEGKHAATVRRLRPGEELLLTDGAGGMARCSVAAAGRDHLDLAVQERHRNPAPALRVTVAQALVKGDRGELAVEMATEAGVDAVLPWRAARCVARWDDGPRGAKALARWRNAATQAVKQSRRSWAPVVHEPVTTRQLTSAAAGYACVLVLHESAEASLAELALPDAGDLLLVVGPEGGIAPDELEALTAVGARAVRLGPTVLRASTAGAVALGALGPLTGRW